MWQYNCRAVRAVMGLTALVLAAGCQSTGHEWDLDPAPEPVMRRVADRVLADFPEPPPFDWGEGVLMGGMMQAGIALDEPRYIDFVQQWADHWHDQGIPAILQGLPEAELKGYCGHWGPGYPVILLYEQTQDPKYLTMARQIADFIMNDATRTHDGGLGHWEGNHQLWVDTLYMVGPLFAHLTRITGEEDYLAEAVNQINIYAGYTQDLTTGLFWHVYDAPTGEQLGVRWGRGNGWVAMTYVEVLRELDPKSTPYKKLKKDFQLLVDGLLRVQDPESRLWHTILLDPRTYLETSASAMILSSLVRGDELDLIDIEDERIRATWAAVAAKVDDEGHFFDVSGGTIPDKPQVYAEKIKGTYTWGTGAFLMAGAAFVDDDLIENDRNDNAHEDDDDDDRD